MLNIECHLCSRPYWGLVSPNGEIFNNLFATRELARKELRKATRQEWQGAMVCKIVAIKDLRLANYGISR